MKRSKDAKASDKNRDPKKLRTIDEKDLERVAGGGSAGNNPLYS